MLILSLGFGIATSNAKDWTAGKKIAAFVWLAAIDCLIFAVCCM